MELKKHITDEKTGISYTLCGDYYLPDLALPEEKYYELGRFGRAKFRHLQQCHKVLLTSLRTSGTLNEYLHSVDEDCEEMFSRLVKQYAEREGVTEQMKADEMMKWLGLMNNIRSRAEEVIMREYMRDCTGEEVCREWLYHIGVPTEKIDALAHDACNTTTCFMPYINAFFQPRKESDRPKVVPDGAVNFAFIGQFAETPRDTIFTTEYSMRTGMESVYTLLDIDRGVPEVWGSKYDVRELLRACYYAIDKKPISEAPLSFKEKELLKVVLKKVKGTDIEILLKESGLIE